MTLYGELEIVSADGPNRRSLGSGSQHRAASTQDDSINSENGDTSEKKRLELARPLPEFAKC
jgi:hypothetical protein